MTPGPGLLTGAPSHLVHHLEEVMGTIVVIDVYAVASPATAGATADGADGRAGQEISGQLAEAVATLHQADETFSTWKPGSPVSRLRRGELSSAQAPLKCPRALTCARWPATCPAACSTRGRCQAVSTRPATSKAGNSLLCGPFLLCPAVCHLVALWGAVSQCLRTHSGRASVPTARSVCTVGFPRTATDGPRRSRVPA
jgi:hypothetical protein